MELLMVKTIHPADVDPTTNHLDLPLATVQRLLGGLTPEQAGRLHGGGVAVTMVDWSTGTQYRDLLLRCLGASGPFVITGGGWWDVVQDAGLRHGDVLSIGWRRGTGRAAPLVLLMVVEKEAAGGWREGRWQRERLVEATVDEVTARLARLGMPPCS